MIIFFLYLILNNFQGSEKIFELCFQSILNKYSKEISDNHAEFQKGAIKFIADKKGKFGEQFTNAFLPCQIKLKNGMFNLMMKGSSVGKGKNQEKCE